MNCNVSVFAFDGFRQPGSLDPPRGHDPQVDLYVTATSKCGPDLRMNLYLSGFRMGL